MDYNLLQEKFPEFTSWKYEGTLFEGERSMVFKMHNSDGLLAVKLGISAIQNSAGSEVYAIKPYIRSHTSADEEYQFHTLASAAGMAPTIQISVQHQFKYIDSTITIYAFAMDYLPYGTYADLIVDPKRRTEENVMQMYDRIEDVVEALKQINVMHHDLSVRNLMFRNEDNLDELPYVIDFGLASTVWAPEIYVFTFLDDLVFINEHMPYYTAAILEKIKYLIRKWATRLEGDRREKYLQDVCYGLITECFRGLRTLYYDKCWEQIIDGMISSRFICRRNTYMTKLSDDWLRKESRISW